jgi:hemerythrin-like domain-containing protein
MTTVATAVATAPAAATNRAAAVTPAESATDAGADIRDYLAIHGMIRRATRALALVTARGVALDDRRARALKEYWQGYAHELHMHHTVEDTIFFPALVDRAPEAVGQIARIDRDHAELDELIAAGHEAFAAIGAGTGTERAHVVLARLERLMAEHLDFEDDQLVPTIGSLFTQAEYDAMHARAMSLPTPRKQLAFIVPFVAQWMDPAAWQRLYASAPLPLKVMYRLTRRRHSRLVRAAFGGVAAEVTWSSRRSEVAS